MQQESEDRAPMGRPPEITPEQIEQVHEMLLGGIAPMKVAERTGVNKTRVYQERAHLQTIGKLK